MMYSTAYKTNFQEHNSRERDRSFDRKHDRDHTRDRDRDRDRDIDRDKCRSDREGDDGRGAYGAYDRGRDVQKSVIISQNQPQQFPQAQGQLQLRHLASSAQVATAKELSDTKEKDAKIIDDKGREIAAAPPEERNAVAAVVCSEAIDARSLPAEAGGCYARKRWKVVNYNEKQRSDGSLAMTLRLRRKRAAPSAENEELKTRPAVLEEEHSDREGNDGQEAYGTYDRGRDAQNRVMTLKQKISGLQADRVKKVKKIRQLRRQLEGCGLAYNAHEWELEVVKRERDEAKAAVKEAWTQVAVALECACCFEPLAPGDAVALGCGHTYCNRQACPSSSCTVCPECRQPIGARVPLRGVLANVCGLLPRDA